jgi:hypothetical protein
MNFLRPAPTPSGGAALFAAPGVEESLGPKAAPNTPQGGTTSTAQAALPHATLPALNANWAAFLHKPSPWG